MFLVGVTNLADITMAADECDLYNTGMYKLFSDITASSHGEIYDVTNRQIQTIWMEVYDKR